MQTQEYAKKPDATVKVRCSGCKKEYPVEQMLKEEPLFPPYETTVEGILECPNCNHRHHVYYMTENLRFRQQKLAELLATWNETKKSKDWSSYRKAQQQYQETFDNTQTRYAAIVKREASSATKG